MTSFDAIRPQIFARAHNLCEGCGRTRAEEVHHRQPRGMGGVHGAAARHSNSAPNLLALCRPCHNITEDEPTLARSWGWLVEHPLDSWTEPALIVPVYGRGWWYLEPDLTYRLALDRV